MEKLFEKYFRKIDQVELHFTRYLLSGIDWSNRLIGIKGARGAGKTTLLLQYARQHLPAGNQTLYVSLDNLYFTEHNLPDFADDFVKQGGKYLLLDEVHRYPNWSVQIKNIYDDHPGLQVIFTGSSILQLQKAKGDLSRRAVMYELAGLSFREFINLSAGVTLPSISLDDLALHHNEFAREVVKVVRPLEYFKDYLSNGYYPYYLENRPSYPEKLAETINLALNTDLPSSTEVSYASIEKLKQLLYIIAQSVPFQPNVSKLAERIGVTRNTLVLFFKYLEELRIVKRIFSSTQGIGLLQKPDKILMHHPNLQYALADAHANVGSIRESFFVNQTGYQHDVSYTKQGDFLVNGLTYEVGGRNKNSRQIQHIENACIVADDLEIGINNKLPLWIFGFLY
jgi:predicted AAA+ superfamily ATPase